MHLVVFESRHWADLAPFTLTRPACLLRCGVTTLLEKHLNSVRPASPLRIDLWVRPELAEAAQREAAALLPGVHVRVNQPLEDGPAVLIDGAAIRADGTPLPQELFAGLAAMTDDAGEITAVRTLSPGLTHVDALEHTDRWQSLADLPRLDSALRRLRHWADLLDHNQAAIVQAAKEWYASPRPAAARINPSDVRIADTAVVAPGVVLDASNGPILLDEHCTIGANSVLEGPCYVGPHSRITPLSLIRGGVSIGPVCRVGGEVSGTIFQGYSNKSHDGFLGDSVVGQWVNCGAGTTTSNLKSTYGPVRASVGRRQVDSGRTLLGCAIGDHAKLATYTMLSAGGYVGVASMLAISGRAPRFTPSFRFVTDEIDDALDSAKAFEIAGRMQERRARKFDAVEQAVLDYARRAAEAVEAQP